MHFSLVISFLLSSGLVTALSSTLPQLQHKASKRQSAPNPIGSVYPGVTGTINGTTTVVPIPYDLARSLVPAQFGILKGAYESLLPGFPKGFYPLIIRGIFDHDIQFNGVGGLIEDFQSIHIFYPFIDLLGDNYTSFAYGKYLLITSTNLEAIAGSEMYGTTTIPTNFEPINDSYAFVRSSSNYNTNKSEEENEIYLNAYANLSSSVPTVKTRFRPARNGVVGPWSFEFYKNVTNQPFFSDPTKSCDNQIALYNTSLSLPPKSPVGIIGDITISEAYLTGGNGSRVFRGVSGVKVDEAFIEKNLVPCASLKGYHASGSGD